MLSKNKLKQKGLGAWLKWKSPGARPGAQTFSTNHNKKKDRVLYYISVQFSSLWFHD
jgi:hypothetical protein